METTTNNQNSKISLPEFSFFRAPIINVKPYKSINIVEAYYYIRGRYAIAQTDALRTLSDIKERRTFKAARFDYCTFSGVFTTRNDNALVRHSGLLCLDFDHLRDVEATAVKLLGDDYFETQLLFLFVTAQASAGKGRLSLCRRLVEPVHRQLRDINKLEYSAYKRDQAEYVANKNNPDIEPPVEPPLRMLFIPANSSATAVFQILNANAGVGLMFETEGDTLAQTFKSEHGNYSDGLRKAFHHEKISYLRRKDHEYVTLETPKLSTVLSGTPRQIQTLVHDSENGLFSRFIFYYMNMRLQWMDVFATPNGCESLDRTFDRLGEEFFSFYKNINTLGSMTFQLSESQQTIFNGFFEELQVEYFDICGQDYIGTVRRLGLITYRIAMILTAVRLMDTGELSQAVTCSDTDFGISLSMARVLVQHAARVFQMLPTDNASLTSVCQAKNILLNALPSSFDRPTYLQTASRIGIPASTADKQIRRYIAQGLLGKEGTKVYVKKEIG